MIKTWEDRKHFSTIGSMQAEINELRASNIDLVYQFDELRKDYLALKQHNVELQTKLYKWDGLPMKYKRMEFNARLQQENALLRGELGALKQQEPVATRLYDELSGASIFHLKLPKNVDPAWKQIPLYLAAGAQPVPEGKAMQAQKGCGDCFPQDCEYPKCLTKKKS